MTDSVSVRRGTPATPRMLFFRYTLASFVIGCLCAASVALAVPWLIDAHGDGASDMRVTAVWFGIAFFVVTVATAANMLRRTLPIHRYLMRASIAADVPPPSPTAIHDASMVHRHATLAGLVAGAVAPLFEVLGILGTSPLPLEKRILRDLVCMAIGALAAQRISLDWAAGLWDWLGRIHPSLIVQPIPRVLAFRSARRMLLSLFCVLLPAAALAASFGARESVGLWIAAGVIAVVASLAGASVTLFRAQVLSAEIVALARIAERFAESDETAPIDVHTTSADTFAVKAAFIQFADRIVHIAAQRAQTYRALEDAQKLKTQFFASMSHDLRSPLNSILGFSDLLAAEVDGPLLPAQRENVRAIQKCGNELLVLLTDVLDSARLEAGRLPIRRAWVPCVELLTEATSRMKPLLRERGLDIRAELQPGLPPVHVDAERVVQIVTSLLTHVARAMERGTIRLRAREAAGPPGPSPQMRIDVVDVGQGIVESQRELIFEAFRSITQPTGLRLGGLGLGLSLARGLARAHGGDVWVDSSSTEGTTFAIALPLTEGPSTT